jgi:hypothetical protein
MTDENKNTPDNRFVAGMFNDRESAERAYTTLEKRGYGKDDVNVIMSDQTRKKHFGNDEVKTHLGTKAMEGTGKGGAIGGALGAIVAAVAAIGTTLLLPGLGLVVAGPLAAAVAGAGAGGVAGGLIGALVGAGIPKDHADVYVNGIKEGKIVMGVRTRNDEDAQYLNHEWSAYVPNPTIR